MKEYKINNEQEPKVPSSETIANYKNFRQLSHEYDRLTKKPKVPLYKDKKAFLVLLLIVLMAFVLAQIADEEEEQDKDVNETTTTINQGSE